ncbi:MAG: hypothetical protein ACRC9U_01925 [Metamycoplasmataceae bacterium]
MNKKLLISLSSLSMTTIALPILATVSCSTEAPKDIDLKITAKVNPQLVDADITVLEGKNWAQQLTVLGKLFTGEDLTFQNQANFQIVVNKSQKTVTLKADKNYKIDGKTELLSNVYSIIKEPETFKNLVITSKSAPATLTNADIKLLQGKDIILQFPLLQKLFEGPDFKISNYTDFSFLVDIEKKVITLMGENGFKIDGKDSLESNAFNLTLDALNISPKNNPVISQLRSDAIHATLTEINKPAFVLNFQFLFNGITTSTFDNLTFTVSKDNVVILTANEGYVFGTQVNGGTKTVQVKYTIGIENKFI